MKPLLRRRSLCAWVVAMPGWSAVAHARHDERWLRFNVLMSNPTANELRHQRVWMYLPMRAAAHVRVVHQECNGDHAFSSDQLGHNIVELKLDSLPAFGQRTVNILVQLQSIDLPAQGHFGAAKETGAWLAPQSSIESDYPAIRELGASLVRPAAQDTALEACRWVFSNMTYAGYLGEAHGALHALRTRTGDCTEYAALLVALCRAAGLPSRMVGGYVSDRSIAPRPADYHDWAEIWIDGRWRVADAQLGNWLSMESHYIPLRYHWDQPINPVGLSQRYRVAGDVRVRL